MLVRLPNKLIAENWDLFKEALRDCVPATKDMSPDRMSRFLEWAMLGRAQCWFMYMGDCEELGGVGVSVVSEDPLNGQKCLLIQAYKVYKPVDLSVQAENFETFSKFARETGCATVVAFCAEKLLAAEFARLTKGRISYAVSVEV